MAGLKTTKTKTTDIEIMGERQYSEDELKKAKEMWALQQSVDNLSKAIQPLLGLPTQIRDFVDKFADLDRTYLTIQKYDADRKADLEGREKIAKLIEERRKPLVNIFWQGVGAIGVTLMMGMFILILSRGAEILRVLSIATP